MLATGSSGSSTLKKTRNLFPIEDNYNIMSRVSEPELPEAGGVTLARLHFKYLFTVIIHANYMGLDLI